MGKHSNSRKRKQRIAELALYQQPVRMQIDKLKKINEWFDRMLNPPWRFVIGVFLYGLAITMIFNMKK